MTFSVRTASKTLRTTKRPSPISADPSVGEPATFPMRINKYLAMKSSVTRRGADELIAKRAVTVNGRIAVLGDKVNEADAVEVRKSAKTVEYVYYACYKPSGTPLLDNRKGTTGFARSMPEGTFPVGSLDQEASGIIIFTNDRRIVSRLENPAHPHPKEYFVESATPLRANFKEKLEAESGPAIACRVALKSETSCYVTITDAKNRIRQICSLFGAETARLTRTAILNIKLRNMKQTTYRHIEGDELAEFLKSLGL